MKLPLLLALLTLPAPAATVNIGTLETSFFAASIPPRLTSISQSTTVTVDLSNLAGLTPGSDITITFTTADDLLWLGGWQADDGDLTFNYHARLTLSAGAFTTSTNETWSFGPAPWVNVNGSFAGYSSGPVPQSFSVTVPWGTDLSAVDLTLTDLLSMTANNPAITESKVNLEYATITTSTIPEPTSGLLTLLGGFALLLRRREPPSCRSTPWLSRLAAGRASGVSPPCSGNSGTPSADVHGVAM